MIFTAPAKVNLYLKVLRLREDGYHDIETIFERVSIFDTVSIEPAEGRNLITCDDISIPTDETSLMGRAVSAFTDKARLRKHFHIKVSKTIPVAAGMGGGSSDAAAILKGINQMSGSPLSSEELFSIGAALGADIPFFLGDDSFAYATGKGEIVTPIKARTELWHVVINPPFGVPTKDVYGALGAFDLTKVGSVDRIFSAFLSKKDIKGIAENLCNDLQTIVLRDFPILEQVFSALREAGAKGTLLSGSGPTVFGIFDEEMTEKAALEMRRVFKPEEGWRVFVAKTY
jgi:4-diphosphocytidyl-2-C-methyl-D-erythritol kinase